MEYKGHPVVESGAVESSSRGWPAKYPGVCVSCRHAIAEGATIERGESGGYRHVQCPVTAPQGLSGRPIPGEPDDLAPSGVSGQVGQRRTPEEAFEKPSGLPNGVWTIEGPRGHRTFRISTVVPARGLAKLANRAERTLVEGPQSDQDDSFRARHAGKRVLELLTGPDNTASYRGLAWYDGQGNKHDTGIGKLWKLGQQANVLVVVFAQLVERNEPLEGYTVHFARTCFRCNRLLTTPESIKRGIGPICAAGGWD